MLFAASDAQTATILIGIGTILSAVIGPIVAVQMAHQAATAEQRRRDMMEICDKTFRDSFGFMEVLKFEMDETNPNASLHAMCVSPGLSDSGGAFILRR